MPEGPEVYAMRDLFGKLPRPIKIKPLVKHKKYQITYSGQLDRIEVHGKHLYFVCGDKTLVVKPLMSGHFVKGDELPYFAKPSPSLIDFGGVMYKDPIKLGKLNWIDTIELPKLVEQYGPDIMCPPKDAVDIIWRKLKRRRIELARVMLDQKVFAGCGNYLRAEALYVAKIPALIKCPELTKEQLETLWLKLVEIAKLSYEDTYKHKIFRLKETAAGELVKATKLAGRTLWHI